MTSEFHSANSWLHKSDSSREVGFGLCFSSNPSLQWTWCHCYIRYLLRCSLPEVVMTLSGSSEVVDWLILDFSQNGPMVMIWRPWAVDVWRYQEKCLLWTQYSCGSCVCGERGGEFDIFCSIQFLIEMIWCLPCAYLCLYIHALMWEQIIGEFWIWTGCWDSVGMFWVEGDTCLFSC